MPEAPRGPIIVVAQGCGPGATLARLLAQQGRTVSLITDQPTEGRAGLTAHACPFTTAADVEAAFDAAFAQHGGVAEVVCSALPRDALAARPITALSLAQWHAGTEGAVRPLRHTLQAVRRRAQGPTAITLLGPNVALTGAAELVPLCTALEGQRSLAKAAARQWGRHGLRINWVAITPSLFDPGFAGLTLPVVPELGPPPPALNRALDLAADVLPVIDFLGGPAARGVTGLMLNLDGGNWMLP